MLFLTIIRSKQHKVQICKALLHQLVNKSKGEAVAVALGTLSPCPLVIMLMWELKTAQHDARTKSLSARRDPPSALISPRWTIPNLGVYYADTVYALPPGPDRRSTRWISCPSPCRKRQGVILR
jgi:hypothetical protein